MKRREKRQRETISEIVVAKSVKTLGSDEILTDFATFGRASLCLGALFPRWLLFILLWLDLTAFKANAADAPAEMGPILVAGQNDADWQPLLQAMAAKGGVYAPFVENRWFPFRKEPTVLKGEMRLSPDLGLSLRYIEPEERTMIIDAKGMVLRDAHGKTRETPADAGDAAMAMLPVLRFDLPALTKLFELHASRRGAAWRFDLVARPNTAVAKMGRMVVVGEGEAIRQLEFRRSATQRVEIIIGEARTGIMFTPEETKKFFR